MAGELRGGWGRCGCNGKATTIHPSGLLGGELVGKEMQRLVVLAMVAQSTMDPANGKHSQNGARAGFVDRKVQDVAVWTLVLGSIVAALEEKLEGLRLCDVEMAQVISWMGVVKQNMVMIGVTTSHIAVADVLQALQYIEGV